MTVSYSLDVSKATFGGFTKLLLRWRGSIYKILWKEFLLFCIAYAILSVVYRCFLDEYQRSVFERVAIFVDTFSDMIPLSFVLGFYVSLVATRWVNQYNALPFTDKVCFLIASFVHGSDNRSRMIRRTLGRYIILLQALTFQRVSTAVKKRFPTTQHLVEAGIMTKEEHSVFEKLDFPYGKWWLPCHWFTTLAVRAMKEGRIKDSRLLVALLQELMKLRDNCATTNGFDWVSVPLVYTQVVTIATYLYAFSLLIGRQYLDPSKKYTKYPVDLYVPIFTLLQFFFYVGWLKVAEQMLNPYGEDDDDYELNFILDRTVNHVYLIVDALHMKHPKVKEDAFWGQKLISLPQTKHSARYLQNPDLGSAHGLDIDEAEYILLFEQDLEENQYRNESIKKKDAGRQNSSLFRRVLSSRFGQSFYRKPQKSSVRKAVSCRQGVSNPSFFMDDESGDIVGSPRDGRKASLKNLVKMSPSTKRTTGKFRMNSLVVKKSQKVYDLERAENGHVPKCAPMEDDSEVYSTASTCKEAPVVVVNTESTKRKDTQMENSKDNKSKGNEFYCSDIDSKDSQMENVPNLSMPPIQEETSRANSLASMELMTLKDTFRVTEESHYLIKEFSGILQELSKFIAAQKRWKNNASKGYESSCSDIAYKDSQKENTLDRSMTPIPQETSRANFLANVELITTALKDTFQEMERLFLVKEVSSIPQELSKLIAAQDSWKDNESKGYESCCSDIGSNESQKENALDRSMPPISEENFRANSLASLELVTTALQDKCQERERLLYLIMEVNSTLQKLSKLTAEQETWKGNKSKGYESCCSDIGSKDSSADEHGDSMELEEEEVFVVIEDKAEENKASEKEQNFEI